MNRLTGNNINNEILK